MNSYELEPCPFCGWNGIHMRKKTRMRESVTGLTYMRGYDQFHPVSLGYVGQEFREEHCYDYRFGIRFYCGKCKAETPYIWGEWHLPTKDEAETFDDMPHACERFDPDEEQATIDKAIAAWNNRTRDKADRIITSDGETDGATGRCECGWCGKPIDPWDKFCRHCGVGVDG